MPLWDNIVNSKWPFILATLVGYPALLHVDVLSSVEFDFCPLSFFGLFSLFYFSLFQLLSGALCCCFVLFVALYFFSYFLFPVVFFSFLPTFA